LEPRSGLPGLGSESDYRGQAAGKEEGLMNNKDTGSAHWSFWVIGVVMLIWNVLGSVNLFWQLNADADALALLPETHQAIIAGRPVWATGGFALGVIGGALGCLLLLFRKSAGFYLFVASLLGIVVTMMHTLKVASAIIDFTALEVFIMIVMPLLVAVFLVWYSKLAERKAWLS
jgi:hypothetical protein